MTAHPPPKGQILISILITLGIFAILSHALFTLIGSSYQIISYNRARYVARHMAEQEIEKIRNMEYGDIATLGGIPAGNIPQSKTLRVNSLNYTVKTSIVFIDDPFNGSSVGATTDYKRVRIEVSWEGLGTSRKSPLVLITDISPQIGINSVGGTLKIVVSDANNNPVADASVTITADSITPNVNVTINTGATGEIELPGATLCNDCYRISVTKSGYSTDRTYSTSEVTNPTKPDVSVLEDQLTQMSFAIDRVSDIVIRSFDSRENGYPELPGVPFRIHGNKVIGTDAYSNPVYKYDRNFTTDSSGLYSLSSLEWDVYYIQMPETTAYNIAGSNPTTPFSLPPDSNVEFSFTVKPFSPHSALIILRDPAQNPIEKGTLRLYEDGGYEESSVSGTIDTPDYGQYLFSGLNDTLIYHLEATASGFLTKNTDIYISGYTVDEIVLETE